MEHSSILSPMRGADPGCPVDCDWSDWGQAGEPCPQHGSKPVIRIAGAMEPDREPVAVVFSHAGIEAVEPGSERCPAKRLISIVGFACQPPKLRPGWSEVLTLAFDDVVAQQQDLGDGVLRHFVLFSEEQAEQVLDFMEKDPDADVAVHCAAGISRSVAVAAFLSRSMGYHLMLRGGSTEERSGNPLVYRMLVTAYLRRVGADALEPLAVSGFPLVLDTPILQRRIYVTAKPVQAVQAWPPAKPVVLAPRGLSLFEGWRKLEDWLPSGHPMRSQSMKLRLRVKHLVWMRWTRHLDRLGLTDPMLTLGEGMQSLAIGSFALAGALARIGEAAVGGERIPAGGFSSPKGPILKN